MINLCENKPKNNKNYSHEKNKFDSLNHDIIRIKEDKKEVDKSIQESLLNNKKNIKRDNFDEPSLNIYINENEKFPFENCEIIDDLSNLNMNLNEDETNEKRITPEEVNINDILSKERIAKKQKNDIFIYGKNNCNYLGNVYNELNPNVKLDNNFIFFAGDSDSFYSDEISSDSKGFCLVENIKSPFFNFISKNFC